MHDYSFFLVDEKLMGLADSMSKSRRQEHLFRPGDIVAVRSEFEAEYRHVLLDTDAPCVVVGYLKDPIQRRDDDDGGAAVLDMAIGIVYPGDTRLTLLNVESYKFVHVELI